MRKFVLSALNGALDRATAAANSGPLRTTAAKHFPGPPQDGTTMPDGTAFVASGTQDIGTGTYTVMTQVAADSLGFEPGDHIPVSLDKEIRPREAEWAEICAAHGLRSGTLKNFVGLSFEYADYTMGYGRDKPMKLHH